MNKKALVLNCFFLLVCLQINANDNYLRMETKLMKSSWDFLPEIPPSFKEKDSIAIEGRYNFDNFFIQGYFSELNLNLERSSEPKIVELDAEKKSITFGYIYNDDHTFSFTSSRQTASNQFFNCITFASTTLGSCNQANFNVSSTKPEYDQLNDNVIKISGFNSIKSLDYKKAYKDSWLNSISFSFKRTKYNYDWMTPLEDITSPLFLNINLNGNSLGNILESGFKALPQRTPWYSNQLNFQVTKSFDLNKNLNLISELDIVAIDLKDYEEFELKPETNLKLRVGLEREFKNMNLLLFADYYKNNLIGFESITFNRRTESYFDKPYGELGLSLKVKF